MERITVRLITDTAEIETLTDRMYGWWGEREGYTREAVRENLLHSLNTDRLPVTFGLYLDEKLVGSYQFTNSDLFVRPDLRPWLANVYLDPAYRGRGLGRVLLATVRENAERLLPEPELYLFTTHTGLYEPFGWIFTEEIDTHLKPRMQRLYRLPLHGAD